MPQHWIGWLAVTVVACGLVWTCGVEWLDRRRERERGFEVKRKGGAEQ
jgi:hypothetical protein